MCLLPLLERFIHLDLINNCNRHSEHFIGCGVMSTVGCSNLVEIQMQFASYVGQAS